MRCAHHIRYSGKVILSVSYIIAATKYSSHIKLIANITFSLDIHTHPVTSWVGNELLAFQEFMCLNENPLCYTRSEVNDV
jgi:hypothetical protein